MKAKLFFLILVVILACGTFKYYNSNDLSHRILMFNIEALAYSEIPGVFCLGYGQVDCPISSVKVYMVRR